MGNAGGVEVEFQEEGKPIAPLPVWGYQHYLPFECSLLVEDFQEKVDQGKRGKSCPTGSIPRIGRPLQRPEGPGSEPHSRTACGCTPLQTDPTGDPGAD